jgi:hypothetical protein
MNMPSEFKAAIEAAQGGPVEIIDGDQRYVLIRAEVYRKMQAVMDDGMKFALQEMGRKSGWNDASMDVYDALDPRKQ